VGTSVNYNFPGNLALQYGFNSTFTYDIDTQGPIDHIDAGVYVGGVGAPISNAGVAILQNNNIYVCTTQSIQFFVGSISYNGVFAMPNLRFIDFTYAGNINSSSLLPSSATPDFSQGTITLGVYAQGSSNGSIGCGNVTFNINRVC
jgi:hypothetical protein